MNARHDRTHESRLARLIGGDPLAPDELAAHAACGECVSHAAELRDVARRLGADGQRLQRKLVDEALAAGAAPGEERIAATLAALLAADGERPRQRIVTRRRLAVVAASIAVLVGGWVAWRSSATESETSRVMLSDGASLELLVPVLPSDERTEFRWRGALPRGGHFRLTIWDARGGRGSAPLFPPVEVEANSWSPSDAQRELLRGDLLWEVAAFDASMEFVAAQSVSVSPP